MSQELSFAASFAFTKDNLSLTNNSNYVETVTGTNFIQSTQLAYTTATDIKFGQNLGVASVGIIIVQNADVTNYVEIDFNGDLTYPIKLGPAADTGSLGGFFMAYLGDNVTAVKARANTATCNIIVSAVQH